MEKIKFQQTPEDEGEEKIEAIEDLRRPVERIMSQIIESVEGGQYSVIIGEDCSGRIPTLIFSRIINKIYDGRNINHPSVYFIAGSKGFSSNPNDFEPKVKAISDFVEKIKVKMKKGSKILIVTDTISTGSSLAPLIDALKRFDVDYEIATITLRELDEDDKRLIDGKIFNGGRVFTPQIYKKNNLSGVYKVPTDLHSNVLMSIESSRDSVNRARQDVVTLADEISKKFVPPKKQKNNQ
ncbi:MAG TPA: hypothetical protein PK367_02800 [Candidatus Paceibacterota bacterium]|nr:hypothetical protein [Candidatus Paceibacterota bacterium]